MVVINMEVEKADQKMGIPKSARYEAFEIICKSLWDNYIRADLIYGRGMMFCLKCWRFYHNDNRGSDHPAEHSEQVQSYFSQAGITSVEHMTTFLWELYGSDPNTPLGQFTMIVSGKHEPREGFDPKSISPTKLVGLQAKLAAAHKQMFQTGNKMEGLTLEN